jgi:hypothetical protein
VRDSGHNFDDLIDMRGGPHPSKLQYVITVESLLPEVVRTLSAWHDLTPAAAAGKVEQ